MSRPTVRRATRGGCICTRSDCATNSAEALAPTIESPDAFEQRCTPWMQERLAGDRWRSWVAEQHGETVGTVWLQLIEKLPNPVAEREWHGYVSCLYVRPAHRGQGLGGELLRECVRECERCRVDTVILWPTPASRGLYTRNAFALADDLLVLRLHAPNQSGAR